MNKHSKRLLLFAALFGAVSVALAAVGAHALQADLLAKGITNTFNKAVDYSVYGGMSLLAIAALVQVLPASKLYFCGYGIACGTLLFSGSLWLYTLGGFANAVSLTPIGGTLLIISWLSVGVIAFLAPTDNPD